MVDVGTDTILTANWWEGEQESRKKESSRHRIAKSGARGQTVPTTRTDTVAVSAMEMDGEVW